MGTFSLYECQHSPFLDHRKTTVYIYVICLVSLCSDLNHKSLQDNYTRDQVKYLKHDVMQNLMRSISILPIVFFGNVVDFHLFCHMSVISKQNFQPLVYARFQCILRPHYFSTFSYFCFRNTKEPRMVFFAASLLRTLLPNISLTKQDYIIASDKDSIWQADVVAKMLIPLSVCARSLSNAHNLTCVVSCDRKIDTTIS